MSLFDLSNKVAVVTGATRGIGRGIVERFAEHGARVVVSSRDQASCDAVAAELDASYGRGTCIGRGIACDIERLEQIERLAERSAEVFYGIDILVANAAVMPFMGPSRDTPPELFERILTRNLHHNFRLCQAVHPHMAKRGGGSIVLIGSLAGLAPFPMLMAYSVAKAGLAHLSRCLADEFAPDGITVNCVAPGSIRSSSSARSGVDDGQRRAAEVPLKRVGEPDDIAGAVVYLASAAGSYVTGVTLPVDGGRSRLSPADLGVPPAHRKLWGSDLNETIESPDTGLE